MAAGFTRIDGDDLILAIRLTPRSAKERVGGVWQDEKGAQWLAASVRAVPEKGKANAALVRLIARYLSLAAKDITLESGDISRLKRLRLSGMAGAAERIEKGLDGQ